MSRPFLSPASRRARAGSLLAAAGLASSAALGLLGAPPAGAAGSVALTKGWCGEHGASFARWAGTSPNLAICGPGPAYGGAWGYVTIPGPGGVYAGYQNATPGFQCVELAERFLAVAYGFSAVKANGAQVAANYHAAYPRTALILNGSPGAVGHAPVRGDVLSLSTSRSFYAGDGHVAVVIASRVDPTTGDGRVTVAQENVSRGDYVKVLGLSHWRLFDPTEPGNVEFQFGYGEWLHVLALRHAPAAPSGLARLVAGVNAPAHSVPAGMQALDLPLTRPSVAVRAHVVSRRAAIGTPVAGKEPGLSVRLVSTAGLMLIVLGSGLVLAGVGARHRRLQHGQADPPSGPAL